MSDPNRFGTGQPGQPGPPSDPWRSPAGNEPPPFFTTPATGSATPPAAGPPPNPYAPPGGLPAPRPVSAQFGGPAQAATAYPATGYPGTAYPAAYPPIGASPYQGTASAVRGNKGLGVAMLVLGGVMVALYVLRALTAPSAVHKLDLYAAQGVDTRRVVTVHDAVGILGLVIIPLFIVGALWLYRAQANARAIAPHQVRRAQAWSWFGWITPIASWFIPKQIVDDSWRVTAPPEAGPTTRGRKRSTALWWALWVTFGLVSGFRVHFWYSVDRPDPGGSCLCSIYTGHRGISPGWEALAAVLAVAAYAAFVPIALGLSDAQEQLVTRLRGSGPVPY